MRNPGPAEREAIRALWVLGYLVVALGWFIGGLFASEPQRPTCWVVGALFLLAGEIRRASEVVRPDRWSFRSAHPPEGPPPMTPPPRGPPNASSGRVRERGPNSGPRP